MLNLVKAVRLPECLLVVVLGFLGFKYSGIPVDDLILTTLFFVIAVTMLQNDWRDRFHDIDKGKTFVYTNPRLFLSWLVIFWTVCCALIVVLFLQHPSTAFFLLGMAFVGSVYSETRRVPLLSVILVTITTASSTLIPLTLGANIHTIVILCMTTASIIFGRETLHDIGDVSVDKGYKKTIPLFLGDRFARIVSTLALVIGCGFAALISSLTLIGSIFILWGLTYIAKDTLTKKVRKRVDIGIVLLALVLFLV